MEYQITKNSLGDPKVYIEWIEDKYEVEAVKLDTGEVYCLSMSYELQQAGYRLKETGRVLHVNYCGERKLISLYKLEKVI